MYGNSKHFVSEIEVGTYPVGHVIRSFRFHLPVSWNSVSSVIRLIKFTSRVKDFRTEFRDSVSNRPSFLIISKNQSVFVLP